jgi:hypothetical protein
MYKDLHLKTQQQHENEDDQEYDEKSGEILENNNLDEYGQHVHFIK